jgi:two-component system, OmpR family, response regulator
LKVLIIDDNRETTDMLSVYFESIGVDFKAINDGKEGLEAIRQEDSSFVLLDVAMPGFSRVDIINALEKDNVLSSKNIMIFTASSPISSVINDLTKSGIRGILKKPLDMDELNALVIKFQD